MIVARKKICLLGLNGLLALFNRHQNTVQFIILFLISGVLGASKLVQQPSLAMFEFLFDLQRTFTAKALPLVLSQVLCPVRLPCL